jgi:hypothetical protein
MSWRLRGPTRSCGQRHSPRPQARRPIKGSGRQAPDLVGRNFTAAEKPNVLRVAASSTSRAPRVLAIDHQPMIRCCTHRARPPGGAVYEAKFMLPWSFSEAAASETPTMASARVGQAQRQRRGTSPTEAAAADVSSLTAMPLARLNNALRGLTLPTPAPDR